MHLGVDCARFRPVTPEAAAKLPLVDGAKAVGIGCDVSSTEAGEAAVRHHDLAKLVAALQDRCDFRRAGRPRAPL